MAKKSGGGGFFGFQVTEMVFEGGGEPKKYIRLKYGGDDVRIYVDDVTYTNFQGLFVRSNPTQKQKTAYATMMKAMLAAYEAGLEHGKEGAAQ